MNLLPPNTSTVSQLHGSTLPSFSRAWMAIASATAASPWRFPVASLLRASGTRATPLTTRREQHIRALRQEHRLILNPAFQLRHGFAVPALRDHDLFHLRGAVLLPGELRERGAVAPGVERQSGEPGQRIYYMEEDVLLRAVRAVPQLNGERSGQRQIGPLGDGPEDREVAGTPEVAANKVAASDGQLGEQRIDIFMEPLFRDHLRRRQRPVHEILGGRRPCDDRNAVGHARLDHRGGQVRAG